FFGKEYDSLADMVAFGLAPAVVAYQWGVVRIAEYGHFWGRFGWLACFFYAVAAALRLARFNARAASADKRYFEGLPSPSAAAIRPRCCCPCSALTRCRRRCCGWGAVCGAPHGARRRPALEAACSESGTGSTSRRSVSTSL